ncbi:L,D-transpeptidase catalytic domain [Rubripirellula lacrimiformis]|uniref:L,D-transpeptidase catalytic domain n=1 Tax=Rubripirellula lacrimiformis TaxID=1930273 RepID=A0A517NGY0_9BACT|nr:L,D-transpeptidase family protein [Rubripirellula lacrimiformis]QDT06385.1 L,D-transpeptidase catalytic domain [Rubripirellula lacrimiformis]
MQTLKTAAIVVLLMTVIYGSWVSLTTPPEPLPPDVEDMLVINDDGTLMLDSVLPPSLGELEINTGIADGSPEITQPIDSVASNLMQPEPFGAPDPMNSPAAVPSSVPSFDGGTSASAASFSISDASSAPAAAEVASDAHGYPSTNQSFVVPDPELARSKFDPNTGERFQASGSDESKVPVTQVSAIKMNDQAVDGLDRGATLSDQRNLGLANAIQIADRQYAADQRKEALATLSIFYSTPDLTGEERSELISRLDPLAADVIYSQRHLLESAHRVGQTETLIEIAEKYDVPWQLLANINQVQDPVTILPGTELKVVRGPFRAEVDVNAKELTLFLGDLYAGRFPIDVGNDPVPKPGTFTVQEKQESRTYYDAAGSPIAPGSPENPYGNAWIDLGGQMCIHGSPKSRQPTDKGCISLAADYADDLYGIISLGSSVTIR